MMLLLEKRGRAKSKKTIYEFVKVNDQKSHLLMNVLNMDALCTEMTSDKAREWDKANNCEDIVYRIELVE